MKRCPECRRDYYDDTLLYCLDDGNALLEGPGIESATAILPNDRIQSEAPTRRHIETNATKSAKETAENPSTVKSAFKKRLLLSLAGIVLLAIAVFFGYWLFLQREAKSIQSIAILPFENNSGDSSIDYLSDGLSESLIDKLSRVPNLKVIARSSSFKFRGSQIDLNDVSNKLGVNAIVTGRVIKLGDTLSVHVEMVDIAANRQIWSEQFDRKYSDIISVQREIADSAVRQLIMHVSAPQKNTDTATTDNEQAYDLYLKARFVHQNAKSTEDLTTASGMLERAIALDPKFAQACAELADVYNDLTGLDSPTYLPRSEALARKAIQLNPDLAEAHLTMAKLLRNNWKWNEAEAEYKSALALNPNLADLHSSYSFHLNLTGRSDLAIEEAKRAVELDPLYGSISSDPAYAYLIAHRWDDAINESNRLLALDPENEGALSILAWVDDARGRHPEALEKYRKMIEVVGESKSRKVQLAYMLARNGDRESAKRIFEEITAGKDRVTKYESAEVYAAIGEHDLALDNLEAAFTEHNKDLLYIRVDPALESLHSDPRYTDLIRRMNFPK